MEFRGLEGLGALNPTDVSMMEKDRRLLTLDSSDLTAYSYCEYLKQWFRGTGLFNVYDATKRVTTMLNYKGIFDIAFKGEQTTYAVIACYDVETTKQFLSRCANGKFSEPALLFAFHRFNKHDKNVALKCNIELVGIDEMERLNNSIVSVFGGSENDNRLLDRVLNVLHNRFKSCSTVQQNKSVQLMEKYADNPIMAIINDGLDQLKASILATLDEQGLNGLVKRFGKFGADGKEVAEDTGKVTFEFGETFQGVNLEKRDKVERVEVEGTDSEAIVAPDTYKTAVVDNIEDFLKITPQSVESKVNLEKDSITEERNGETEC